MYSSSLVLIILWDGKEITLSSGLGWSKENLESSWRAYQTTFSSPKLFQPGLFLQTGGHIKSLQGLMSHTQRIYIFYVWDWADHSRPVQDKISFPSCLLKEKNTCFLQISLQTMDLTSTKESTNLPRSPFINH